MKQKEDQMGLVLPPSFFKKERRQRKLLKNASPKTIYFFDPNIEAICLSK